MMGEEQALELAELRSTQERESAIARAAAAVSADGTDECVECGEPISSKRRIAAPFATRCVECQTLHEQEKYHR